MCSIRCHSYILNFLLHQIELEYEERRKKKEAKKVLGTMHGCLRKEDLSSAILTNCLEDSFSVFNFLKDGTNNI